MYERQNKYLNVDKLGIKVESLDVDTPAMLCFPVPRINTTRVSYQTPKQ